MALSLKFDERLVKATETQLRARRPEVHLPFVKPQRAGGYARPRTRYLSDPDDP